VEPYAPRRVRSHGTREINGWRVKVYSIVRDGSPPDWSAFEPGMALAFDSLPMPAKTEGRPGLAFLIAHAGRGILYMVLCWWDRENELPIRVWVAEHDGATAANWRAARGSESVCVWDLDIIWHERQAYIATILAGGEEGSAEREYLERMHG